MKKFWLWFTVYIFVLTGILMFLGSSFAHADTLDIAIIGDDYISQDNFRNDAEAVASSLIQYVPYSEYQGAINFIIVWNQDDLYCAPSASMSRLLICNETVVKSKLASLNIVYDKVIVLWNNGQYAGSGGSIATAYNGSWMNPMVAHEFGHSFGGLMDEYLLSLGNGQILNKMYSNCYAGDNSAQGWFKECNYGNWYRQSECSIMRSLGCPYFNQISADLIRNQLSKYTTNKPPVVVLSASPLDGVAPLTVTFTAEVSGNAPFTYTWSF